jgi:hypothetical protein
MMSVLHVCAGQYDVSIACMCRIINQKVSTDNIYKITDSKGKKCIVSTIDYKKIWKQHEEAGEDIPLHMAIKEKFSRN